MFAVLNVISQCGGMEIHFYLFSFFLHSTRLQCLALYILRRYFVRKSISIRNDQAQLLRMQTFIARVINVFRHDLRSS